MASAEIMLTAQNL